MRASYAFVLQKNNVEVSTYSVLTPTFIIEPLNLARPTEYPRQASRDGVATPDTQPNTTGKISITTLIRIRQEKIMFSFQNKEGLLPGRDARKNLSHTSECGGRNTPFHGKFSKSAENLARGAISFNITLFQEPRL